MRRHINVLYGVVVILLIIQVISFISLSSTVSKVVSNQEQISQDFNRSLEELKQDNQYKVDEIVKSIAQQRNDFEGQINLLKSSQEDFSGIIEDVIKDVVSVRTDKSAATGFIVDSRGYIVTNFHVIQGASFVNVQTYDGSSHDATVIGVDQNYDLALLKIGGLYDKLELADINDVQIGEKVIAIGNPLGLSFTVTEGIVSAIHRKGPNGQNDYIQTDVTLNPGNSGGPLIDKEGKVIGINNFKIGGAESLGFALESNIIKERVNQIANETIIA